MATVVFVLVAVISIGCGENDDPKESDRRPPRFTSGEAANCYRPYSSSSPWNTPIGPTPTYHSKSESYVDELDGELTSDPTQYTSPVYEVSRETPRVTVHLSGRFSIVSRGDSVLEILSPESVELPIPEGAEPAAGSDASIILLDPLTGDEWGLWKLERNEDGEWSAVNGYRYNIRWSAVPPRDAAGRPFHSRGAGIPYLAGIVRLCEIARGRIDHAIGFTYDHPSGDYVYPATKSDGTGDPSKDFPEGARLQLDPDLTERDIREWGCLGPCLTIARALQEYGMYVMDNGGRPKVRLEYEATAGWNGRVDAETVSPIPLSAFKWVAPPRP